MMAITITTTTVTTTAITKATGRPEITKPVSATTMRTPRSERLPGMSRRT